MADDLEEAIRTNAKGPASASDETSGVTLPGRIRVSAVALGEKYLAKVEEMVYETIGCSRLT